MPEISNFHETSRLEVILLMEEETPRKSLSLLFRLVDEMVDSGSLETCDDLLRNSDVSDMGIHVMVGLLTITGRVKDYLPSREGFLLRCYNRIESFAPDRVERLMRGFL